MILQVKYNDEKQPAKPQLSTPSHKGSNFSSDLVKSNMPLEPGTALEMALLNDVNLHDIDFIPDINEFE